MRLQMKLALANPHRQLHVLAERQRQVAIFRRTYVCDILGAVIGVVGAAFGRRTVRLSRIAGLLGQAEGNFYQIGSDRGPVGRSNRLLDFACVCSSAAGNEPNTASIMKATLSTINLTPSSPCTTLSPASDFLARISSKKCLFTVRKKFQTGSADVRLSVGQRDDCHFMITRLELPSQRCRRIQMSWSIQSDKGNSHERT
jgi:hypothetical protein